MTHDEVMARAEKAGSYYRFPPAVWHALYRQTQRVDGWWLSPSGATGCPRKQLLMATEDYWLNPNKIGAMLVGTAMHDAFETGDDYEEVPLSMSLRVPLPDGPVVDFPLRGTADKYEPRWRRLTDYKSTSEFRYWDAAAKKQVPKVFPEERHVVQVNLYRMLLEHHGHPVEDIQIFYFRPTADLPRRVVAAPLWDLEEIYLEAVAAAGPLALARETETLPPCTCLRRADDTPLFGLNMDRDLCREIDDDAWREGGGPDRVPVP